MPKRKMQELDCFLPGIYGHVPPKHHRQGYWRLFPAVGSVQPGPCLVPTADCLHSFALLRTRQVRSRPDDGGSVLLN